MLTYSASSGGSCTGTKCSPTCGSSTGGGRCAFSSDGYSHGKSTDALFPGTGVGSCFLSTFLDDRLA
eukprot:2075075-Prorocentrum_lima.AAC.1